MKIEAREKGLFRNGKLWWIRVGTTKRSTGTPLLPLANRIVRMLHDFQAQHVHRDLILSVLDNRLQLMELYDAHSVGRLDALRSDLARAAIVDVDLEPYVEKWQSENLATRTLSADTRADYVRQLRAFIPRGTALPCSRFTEEYVQGTLQTLPVSDSTRRRYLSALHLFCRYVRRRVPSFVDPLEFLGEWGPKNGNPRTTWWNHKQTMDVLDRMEGEARRALALMLGSGMELSALRALTFGDLLGGRAVVAKGTKNMHRHRTVIVDAWADSILRSGLPTGFPTQRVFAMSENEMRTHFYRAQVDANMIAPPKRGASGKMLWGDVGPHSLHDCRHTWAIVRGLGLDGEQRRSIKFVASQLGHATEQMVLNVYGRVGVEQRELLALQEMEMDKPPATKLEIAR